MFSDRGMTLLLLPCSCLENILPGGVSFPTGVVEFNRCFASNLRGVGVPLSMVLLIFHLTGVGAITDPNRRFLAEA